MNRDESSPIVNRRFWRRRRPFLAIILVIVSVSAFGVFYAWEYRPQTLINVTTSIQERWLGQFNVDVMLGNRDVKVVVDTFMIQVFVTLWWQQGTSADSYLFQKPVGVNSTWTSHISVHNSGGTYFLLIEKSEAFGEGLTTIHAQVQV